MKLRMFSLLLAAASAIGTANASTIATFSQLDGTASLFSFSNALTTMSGTANIVFNSHLPSATSPTLVLPSALTAAMTWSMSSTTAAAATGDGFTQAGFSGSFNIVDSVPGLNFNKVLLSGTLNNGKINISGGGIFAQFTDFSPPMNDVHFASDYLGFTGVVHEAINMTWSEVNPTILFPNATPNVVQATGC